MRRQKGNQMKIYFKSSYLIILVLIGTLIAMPLQIIFGQGKQKVEVSLGLGAASPSESNPLNVPGEKPLPTSFSGNASLRWPIGDMMLVGLRGFLSVQNLSDYQFQQNGSNTTKTIDFRLTSYTLAIDTKIYLIDSRYVAPYLLLAIAYSGGSISNGDLGNLSYQGFSAGGGLGVWFSITKTFGLSFDVLRLAGSGKWKEKPASNATSDDYDPSSTIISMNFSFLVNH
jgi:hypothetical protein